MSEETFQAIILTKQELNYLITALGVTDLNYGLSDEERELFKKLTEASTTNYPIREEC